MKLVLPALAAVVAALLEQSVAPHFGVNGAQPHLVLVLALVATMTISAQVGVTWAFAGGLALDVLAGRPLGSTAFTLLVVVSPFALIRPPALPLRLLATIAFVPVASALGFALLVIVQRALGMAFAVPQPASLLAGIAYDTVVAILVVPLAAFTLHRRARAGRVYA
jgi:rod shape-determining protein MreD